jgi:hypothetical protein
VSKVPDSWESIDRCLALILEQRLLDPSFVAVESVADAELELDEPELKKKKTKKKKKKKTGGITPSTTADVDGHGSDRDDDSDFDTEITTPSMAPSPPSLSTALPSTACDSSLSLMSGELTQTDEQSPDQQAVSPARFVSLVWSGFAQQDQEPEETWHEVRRGRKSRRTQADHEPLEEAEVEADVQVQACMPAKLPALTDPDEVVSLGHPAHGDSPPLRACISSPFDEPDDVVSLGHPAHGVRLMLDEVPTLGHPALRQPLQDVYEAPPEYADPEYPDTDEEVLYSYRGYTGYACYQWY